MNGLTILVLCLALFSSAYGAHIAVGSEVTTEIHNLGTQLTDTTKTIQNPMEEKLMTDQQITEKQYSPSQELSDLLQIKPQEGSFSDSPANLEIVETSNPLPIDKYEHSQDSMWDEEEYHAPYFGDISEDESHEGEVENYEWMKEFPHENIDQVEAGLMHLLRTAHQNGFTANDIINDLREKFQKVADKKKLSTRYSESTVESPQLAFM